MRVHGQVYVHQEGLPLSLLRDGLEKLSYKEVVMVLTKEARPMSGASRYRRRVRRRWGNYRKRWRRSNYRS